MSINRAAIAAQLLQRLQQALNANAVNTQLAEVLQVTPAQITPIAVHLLQHPSTPPDTNSPASIVLSISDEQIANSNAPDASVPTLTPDIGRKLQFSVTTQIQPMATDAVLQILDVIAEQVELAFSNDDEAKPWLQTHVRHTNFAFETTDTGSVIGVMTQHFSISYHLQREDTCTAVRPKEIYLSQHGGPYELVASIPND